MHKTHLSAFLRRNYSDLAWKVYKKPTKRHYRDNIEYHDILTHDDCHQLFLISPIPTQCRSISMKDHYVDSQFDKNIMYVRRPPVSIWTRYASHVETTLPAALMPILSSPWSSVNIQRHIVLVAWNSCEIVTSTVVLHGKDPEKGAQKTWKRKAQAYHILCNIPVVLPLV